jgi:putative NADH-flavin reductase
MKNSILVIGANGGIGRQTVETALASGFQVTAILRDPSRLSLTHPNLEIVKGDILEPAEFQTHLRGKDAVISAIGVKGGLTHDEPTTLYSRGNSRLLEAMRQAGAKRVFFISASAVEISPLLPFIVRLVAKYVLQKLLRHMYADLRAMERLIRESEADWTIIRPPRLTDKPATGKYRWSVNAFLRNCLSISRGDVAHFMLHHIDDTSTFNGIVEIGY